VSLVTGASFFVFTAFAASLSSGVAIFLAVSFLVAVSG